MKCNLSPLIALASLVSIAVPLSANAQNDPVNLLWTQYGIANKTLKLTAHTDLDPMDPVDAIASLELKSGDTWKIVASAEVEPLTAMAAFRVENWDSDTSHVYRVVSGST